MEEQREAPRLRVEDAMAPAAGSEVMLAERSAHLHPDASLEAALPLLAKYDRLLVVTRTRPYRVLGALTLEDVHRAYGIHKAPLPAPPPDARGSVSEPRA